MALENSSSRLAIAGVVAPLWFALLVIVQTISQPSYDQVALPVSALAAWPLGWVQNLNFFVFGPLLIAYAIGLHRGVHGARLVAVGFLVISGLGVVLAGLTPWRHTTTGYEVPFFHRVAAVIAFGGAGFGLAAMSRDMRRDRNWRDLATLALVGGIAIVVGFVATAGLGLRDGAPLHAWAGLMQRFVILVWLACTLRLALRLRRVRTP